MTVIHEHGYKLVSPIASFQPDPHRNNESRTKWHYGIFFPHTILADMLSGVSSPASSIPSSPEQKVVITSRSGLLLVVRVASRSTLVKYYIKCQLFA
jgi:hypothetical protein